MCMCVCKYLSLYIYIHMYVHIFIYMCGAHAGHGSRQNRVVLEMGFGLTREY